MSREQVKAAFYIQQLEEARCQGTWSTVPELIRKVKKHAPHRSCLVATAESEHAIATAAQIAPTHEYLNRLSTVNAANPSASIISGISKYILRLVEGIKKEQTSNEDVFQAQVCLSVIYWYLGEYDSAITNVPMSIGREGALIFGSSKESSELTRLGVLKAFYVKANSQQKISDYTAAMGTYEAVLPIISGIIASPKQGNEVLAWAELLLTDLCMLSSDIVKKNIASTPLIDPVSVFRLWDKFWESQAPKLAGGYVLHSNIPRRLVWKEYFATLSVMLKNDFRLSLDSLPFTSHHASSRAQTGAELKKIESRYESLLTSEVPFPKSHETSEEIEEFIEIVMQNWQVLRGIDWRNGELGEGGVEGLSRGTLDTLYRAARKTFHSTAILRHLFTVHLAIAEFDLASKAFNTYITMVKKTMSRSEDVKKSKKCADDVEMVLRTVSKYIEAICCYGSQQATEKAKEMSQLLESWLIIHDPLELNTEDETNSNSQTKITPNIFALGWRSAGIGYAQWARSTFDAASRSDLQAEAVRCFRKSLSPQYESSTDPRTLYALGVILAERREISSAIEAVKTGLLSPHSSSSWESKYAKRFARERLLIPLWHLLALLLSARQEFLTAKKSCEAVFEQFQPPESKKFEPNEIKQKPNSNQSSLFDLDQGITDNFYDSEKENLLEVKMTQLTLIELSEGPDIAVNSCDELLSLYTTLFGESRTFKDKESETISPVSPKSTTSTIRSFKNGLLGRSGQKLHTNTKNHEQNNNHTMNLTRTLTGSKAPTIHVTSEVGKATTHRSLTVSGVDKSPSRSSSRLRETDNNHFNSEKIAKVRVRSHSSAAAFKQSEGKSQTNSHSLEIILSNSSGHRSDAPTKNVERPTSAGSIRKNNLNVCQSKLEQLKYVGLACSQSHENSEFMEHSSAGTQFSKDEQRQRKLIILFRIWILISGFYRRASMYDDALSAIDEAQILLINILDHPSDNLSSSDWTWRTGKSIAELWGDIYAEFGQISIAEGYPYTALKQYETALTHFRDHVSSIVGLSNILMDIYCKDLLPPPSVPALILPKNMTPTCSPSNTTNVIATLNSQPSKIEFSDSSKATDRYLGLLADVAKNTGARNEPIDCSSDLESISSNESTSKSSSTLLDRLAARDRAYGLLAAVTKTRAGWNSSEAWFALARAYEESGQSDRAKEVLWWCVELEESRAVRDWTIAGSGGYVL
ncbi:hypothetical protein K3495_g123 [Podosphaera aphanis]|nr:hypothetical protein K3495_g123 [Podosphaera aphanis]